LIPGPTATIFSSTSLSPKRRLSKVRLDDDDPTRREARQLGAKFFFRKPVDGQALIEAIEWAVSADGGPSRG
jgi:hypothetical protein